ncbi:hypothetical protein IU449_25100 [Nocardia higoensis]|uniref:Low molecular weight antigen MTB12-like C-terminal domain-containing protein n=1 Tax=Nocardia higoensis TaxID=228599 RepID=A0ABS0DH33_9NOCA|nr:hypothetical protein [Nocardia higoensis]MBF6357780.1 hypothetical protein [Nocardia higoensis]
MNLPRPRLSRAALAACLASVAVLAAGCGGSDADEATVSAESATTAPAAGAQQPPVPLPSPADLNAGFQLALDPDTPATLKTGAVQGADADPTLIDKLAQASQANGITLTIVSVDYQGDAVLQATADMTLDGKPVQGPTLIPFVAEDGRWKLQLAWACQMLANTQTTSPACAA